MTIKKLNVDETIERALRNCTIRAQNDLWLVTMPQLDRDTYVKVNKFLEAAGGKWNRSSKAHLFSEDPTYFLQGLENGKEVIVDNLDFFFTPPPVVDVVREMISQKITAMTNILEPSAGEGHLLDALHGRGTFSYGQIVCVELDPKRAKKLEELGCTVYCQDFLTYFPGEVFDLIIMNPPFSKQADLDHVLHAFKNCLRPGGEMIALMTPSILYRDNSKTRDFLQEMDQYIIYKTTLPDGSFNLAGTGVRAMAVKYFKPA